MFGRLITLFYVPLKINKLLKINNLKYLLGLVNNTILYSIPMLIIVTITNNYIDKNDNSIVQIIIITSVVLLTNIISFDTHHSNAGSVTLRESIPQSCHNPVLASTDNSGLMARSLNY